MIDAAVADLKAAWQRPLRLVLTGCCLMEVLTMNTCGFGIVLDDWRYDR